MNRGFTLLEVLIALAILSTVALLAVRVSGDSLTQLAETGWEDGVLPRRKRQDDPDAPGIPGQPRSMGNPVPGIP